MIPEDMSLEETYRAMKKKYNKEWKISTTIPWEDIISDKVTEIDNPCLDDKIRKVASTGIVQTTNAPVDDLIKNTTTQVPESVYGKPFMEKDGRFYIVDTFQMMTSFTVPEMEKIYSMKAKVTSFSNLDFGIYASDIIIAGGCFTSFYYDQKPKDIDIFVLNDFSGRKKDAIIEALNKVYKNSKYAYHDATKYMKNNRIKQIINYETGQSNGYMIQLIFTDYKTRKELLDDFDMLHCCVSYDVMMNKLYITRGIYDAIDKKRILSNNGNRIENWRLEKMLSKSWTIG